MLTSRFNRSQTVAVTASLSTTEAVLYGEWAGGTIHVPAGSSIASLTFYSAPEINGDFLPLQDLSGESAADLALTVEAGKAYAIPDLCAGCRALKMVGDAAGNVLLSLKG